jgi:alanyl-tRNA synthetase
MMTEKLYEADTLMQECTAVVQACEPLNKGYAVVLDRTCLFAEGGGQLSDKGYLETGDGARIPVSHVSVQQGRILHHCQKSLPIGTAVCVHLDWDVRLDRMQQHYGEHMLAYSFWKLFGANNIGFHMSEHMVAINLDQEMTAEQVQAAELYANQLIWQDRKFHAAYMTQDEARKLDLRKRNDHIQGLVRIVSIDGADACMCCGTQPPSTGVIGIIKIKRVEKIKEGSRVEFLSGRRAFEDIGRIMEAASQGSNLLSVKEEKLPDGIRKLKEEILAVREDLRHKSWQILQPDIDQILARQKCTSQGQILLFQVTDRYDHGLAKMLLKRLMEEENALVVIMYAYENKLYYMIGSAQDAKADCRPYIKIVNATFNGKGGGKPDLCQGSAALSDDWQEKANQFIGEM